MSFESSNLFGKPSSNNLENLVKTLDEISYESRLGKNLRNTLRKFDKEELFNELKSYRKFLKLNRDSINGVYRIKSLQSIYLKYERYYPDKQVSSCFNDVLGLRVFCEDLVTYKEDLVKLNDPSLRIVDLINGKKSDDGYRALHLYYQKTNYHYPIEIQVWSRRDVAFHNWMHKYSYKYKSNEIGICLRELFDRRLINTEEDFITFLNSEENK